MGLVAARWITMSTGSPSNASRYSRERTVGFGELVEMMVDSDMEMASHEKTLRDAGHELPAHSGHDQ